VTQFNAAFWKWFGNSQVVDENGQPLVVYHGTPENFSEFRKRGTGRLAALHGPPPDSPEGFFFTTSPKTAEAFTWKEGELTGGIMPVYLSIQNPWVTDFVLDAFTTHRFAEILRQAKREGYDGVAAFMQYRDEESSVFVAFYPEQIKSATGNDGTWDSDDPDITSNPPVYFRETLDKSATEYLQRLHARGFKGVKSRPPDNSPEQCVPVAAKHAAKHQVDYYVVPTAYGMYVSPNQDAKNTYWLGRGFRVTPSGECYRGGITT
jgi:hypothetical protein